MIALPYIKSVKKTVYKCSISLKNTVNVARIRPAPIVNIRISTRGTTANNINHVKGACVAIITRKSTTNDNRKVIKLEIVTPSVYIYLGMYIFLIMDAFL